MDDLQIIYDSDIVARKAEIKHAKDGDCGFDLYNASDSTVIVGPYCSKRINTGIRMKIPDGYCGILRSRSSTFTRKGLFVVTGVIDSGYTGPLYIIVWNPVLQGSNETMPITPILIKPWERVSQLLILPVPKVKVVRVFQLPETERGQSGFGSTGV